MLAWNSVDLVPLRCYRLSSESAMASCQLFLFTPRKSLNVKPVPLSDKEVEHAMMHTAAESL